MKTNDTAFIVVDTQRAVVAKAFETERVVGNILAAEKRAREAGCPVVWVQHVDENLVEGSDAWSLAQGLEPKEGDILVSKRYNSSFEDTGLDETLRGLGVKRVVLAGAATNWCIRATAYGVLERGYDLVLASDAHTTKNLDVGGGRVIPAESLIAELNVGLGNVEYPGRTSRAVPVADIEF